MNSPPASVRAPGFGHGAMWCHDQRKPAEKAVWSGNTGWTGRFSRKTFQTRLKCHCALQQSAPKGFYTFFIYTLTTLTKLTKPGNSRHSVGRVEHGGQGTPMTTAPVGTVAHCGPLWPTKPMKPSRIGSASFSLPLRANPRSVTRSPSQGRCETPGGGRGSWQLPLSTASVLTHRLFSSTGFCADLHFGERSGDLIEPNGTKAAIAAGYSAASAYAQATRPHVEKAELGKTTAI
jgi:hypothetical protein